MDDAIALTKAVGTLELLLAIGACAFAGKSRTPAVVGIGLAVFFAGLVLRVMILNPHLTNCGCFGSLFSELAGQHISWHFSLNIVLATLFAGSLLLQQSAMEFARRIAPISADAHRAPAAAS